MRSAEEAAAKTKARTLLDAVKVKKAYEDGTFELPGSRFSKMIRFADINYYLAGTEDKESMFFQYGELLGVFDADATTKITVAKRRLDKETFQKKILFDLKSDGLNEYRLEYNKVILDKFEATDGIVKEIYITVTIKKKDYKEAKSYFARVFSELKSKLAKLGSAAEEIDIEERLRFLYDIFNFGKTEFSFNMEDYMRKGYNFKEAFLPESIEIKKDHMKFGDRYARVLFLKDYPSWLRDDFISQLTDISSSMVLSVDVISIPTAEAVQEANSRKLGVETNIANWQRRQNKANNFSAALPYDMELARKETDEFLEGLQSKDEKMLLATLTLIHFAASKEELDNDTAKIKTKAAGAGSKMNVLQYQQLEGLNTVLPLGLRQIDVVRTLTTSSLSVFTPFYVQEFFDTSGIWMGENPLSGNLIILNREKLQNPNCFVLGVPGSGKSFLTKEQIFFIALQSDDDILILDPEREYSELVRELGGEVINIYPGSPHYINAMDMEVDYAQNKNAIRDKSNFILSLFSQIKGEVSNIDKSIIDRCVKNIFEISNSILRDFPTLTTLQKELRRQPEIEALDLATTLELYTSGSLDLFSHETNVASKSRIINYDILDLGQNLMPMGALVLTEAIINRVSANDRAGKRTHIFIDEFHCLFENDYSAAFFANAWRRFRKRNGFPTAITQNVSYLLENQLAQSMLSNSEFVIMLNQSASDREQLAALFNLSENQLSYIDNADAGSGLFKYGKELIPFKNEFPKKTQMYRIMTTKPQDKNDAGSAE
jgi:hypothetical protein